MVGDKILKFSRIFAIVMTVILVIAGFVLIIVGVATQIWGVLIGGAACYPLIIFIWIQKLFIDGYGLIVLSSENNLKKDGVESYIDKVKEQQEKARANTSDLW